MQPPKGADADEKLQFDIELLSIYGENDVRVVGPRDDIYKTVKARSESWETPREPYEVLVLSMALHQIRTKTHIRLPCLLPTGSGMAQHSNNDLAVTPGSLVSTTYNQQLVWHATCQASILVSVLAWQRPWPVCLSLMSHV